MSKFNPDWSKPLKVSFWTKVRLWFKPTYTSYDIGSGDSTVIWYKLDNGKIYLKDCKNEE